MPAATALIAAWARSAVMPHGGAFRHLHAHEIAAPVVQALLARAGLQVHAVDTLVCGNALGAGGNPARMVALAAGLPDACAALSVDTQCCSGLDAVTIAVGLLASGQARVVIAGGAEAWSRSPLRYTRPMTADEVTLPYDRPAFAPDPQRDPDLLEAAALFARAHGISRLRQDTYALQSHQRAVAGADAMRDELVDVLLDANAALAASLVDAYPRNMSPARAGRMPVAAGKGTDYAVSSLAISAKADGAAFVLLVTQDACHEWGIQPQAQWLAGASVGCASEQPMLAAAQAAQLAMQRAHISSAGDLQTVELHDAFAVQGLQFCSALGLHSTQINRHGGGIARGHPIGASGAVALVRLLADMKEQGRATGLAAVAGAGGIGAAAIVQTL
jgi:acetyl-CoA C-acetyltransferase